MVFIKKSVLHVLACLLLISPVTLHADVASVDSGANTAVTGDSFDFVNGDSTANDTSPNTHGTFSALNVKSTDPAAAVTALKVTESGFGGSSAITDNAVNYAAGLPDVKVVVKGVGAVGSQGAWRAVTSAGKIAVFKSGNDFQAEPTQDARHAPALAGRGLIVGAVNGSSMPSYSNRAGTYANHYMVASGSSPHANYDGTSWSAAYVAGAAHAVWAAHPGLAPQTVVQILKDTATDLGAPGVDAVFGYGRLNLQAAKTAQGGSVGGGSSGGGAAALLAVGIGAAVIATNRKDKDAELEKTLYVDRYGRDYYFDMTEHVSIKPSRNTIQSVVDSLEKTTRILDLFDTENAHLNVLVSDNRSTRDILDYYLAMEDEFNTHDPVFAFDGRQGNVSYQMNFGTDPHYNYGVAALTDGNLTDATSHDFLSDRLFTAPYAGFSRSKYAAGLGLHLNDQQSLKIGISRNGDNGEYASESTGSILEWQSKISDKFGLGLQFGYLQESGGLFGGAKGGPFSVADADTVSVGLSGAYKLTDRFSLIGNYSEGLSNVKQSKSSLLQDFSQLRSNSYGLGLVARSIFNKRDKMGIAVSKPLRITDGNADLRVPQSLDQNNEVVFNTDRIRLSPAGNETTLEAFYKHRLKIGIDWVSYLTWAKEPNHLKDAGSEVTVLTALRHVF